MFRQGAAAVAKRVVAASVADFYWLCAIRLVARFPVRLNALVPLGVVNAADPVSLARCVGFAAVAVRSCLRWLIGFPLRLTRGWLPHVVRPVLESLLGNVVY